MQNIEKSSVIEQLKKIPYGTLLNVMWLDASTVRNADLQKLPLRNDYVETRRSTVGEYKALQRGAAQKAWHVVLRMVAQKRIWALLSKFNSKRLRSSSSYSEPQPQLLAPQPQPQLLNLKSPTPNPNQHLSAQFLFAIEEVEQSQESDY